MQPPQRQRMVSPGATCAYCHGHIRTRLPVYCPQCRYLFYCSPRHQQEHWYNAHYRQCPEITQEFKMSKEAEIIYDNSKSMTSRQLNLQRFYERNKPSYLGARLYGRACLLRADQEKDNADQRCKHYAKALDLFLEAEQFTLQGYLAHPIRTTMHLYQMIYYTILQLYHCDVHDQHFLACRNANMNRTQLNQTLLESYKAKQKRFMIKSIRDLLGSETHPPALITEVCDILRHAQLDRPISYALFMFWFEGLPLLLKMGFARWSNAKKRDVITRLCKPMPFANAL